MTIDFDAFEEIAFPERCDIVYVFHYICGEGILPFYVGESSRHFGRFGDYISANFSAATDFKVGEAVKYLREKGLGVVVKFKASQNRKEEEKRIIKHLRGTFRLLNDLKGYHYKSSDEDSERLKIQQFIEQILKDPYCIKHSPEAPKKQPREELGTSPSSGDKPRDTSLSIPEQVRLICEELAVGGNIIHREDILRLAKERGINEDSVLPADYCDNTETSKWSTHSFLHSVARGKYILR
ncbi:MAG: hypothetical protein WA666_00250 [Nitrospirota bacterium]